jgi:methionyl-tRNA formyltransferase
MLEPQCTGMTIHELTEAIDGGKIIHQSVANLVRGDGIHELAARAVISLCDEIEPLLRKVQNSETINTIEQTTTGRIWRAMDWRPEHLHLIYDTYSNRIVDRYLDGEFVKSPPKLVRQI